MKTLLLIAGLACSVAADAQQYKNTTEMLHAVGAADDKVPILGEAEAREAVLHPKTANPDSLRYLEFITAVSASYSERPGLSDAESGSLVRALYAMGPEPPTKFAVHFKVDAWFRANVDPKRYEAWKALPVYPEYRYGYLLAAPPQGGN